MNQAWNWEQQALSRARFISGSASLEAAFNRVRLDALCRERDEVEVATELAEMRQKIAKEQESKPRFDATSSPKHRPGGLVDIEFVAQLGVLVSARLYPRVIRATGTQKQIDELTAIAWLSAEQANTLQTAMARLREQKLMEVLIGKQNSEDIDTLDAAEVCAEKLGKAPVPGA